MLGPRTPDTLDAIAYLGELRIDQTRYAEAEAMLRGCLEIQKQTMPSDYRRYLTESLLGTTGLSLDQPLLDYQHARDVTIPDTQGCSRVTADRM